MTPGTDEPTVFVVDDDPAVLTALVRVLHADRWRVEAFESAEAMLARRDAQAPGCLVLDVDLPGLDGLALQCRLNEAGHTLPIVFLTGHGDIPMSVRAVKAGATDCEVLAALAAGKLNKHIAGDLGIVAQTVKFHRARIMERLQARTAAELMHIAAKLGIEGSASKPRSAPSLPETDERKTP